VLVAPSLALPELKAKLKKSRDSMPAIAFMFVPIAMALLKNPLLEFATVPSPSPSAKLPNELVQPSPMSIPLMPMQVPLAGPTPLSEPTATAEATPATKAARTTPLSTFSFAVTRRMSIGLPP
jgi:hypothetical protein